ncbi:MAG: ABC transporter permease [Pyrinomonadaceae bacterium]|nr:ABC transporter permease [Pyrinomonadaceae bacterium]
MNDNLVFSNIFHRPARTFVSVLGIAVGVLLIIFTVGLSNGTMRERATRDANVGAEIMVRASGTFGLSGSEPFRLPMTRVAEISKIEGVSAVVPIGQNLVSADDATTGSRLVDGVNFDEYANIAGLKIIEGRKINSEGNEAVIDTGWQAQRKVKIGSTLRMYEKDFTIVGTYEPASGARIKIPLAVMQRELTDDTQTCTAALVKVTDPNQQETVAERISQKFPDDQIVLTKDFQELYAASIPALDVFLNVVIGVAAIISALVILLTMYTTVTERTRQIGVLKSLGMSKSGIAWTITQEALLISFLGVALGVIATVVLRFILMQTTTLQVSIDIKWIAITLAGGLIGGAIGALYPALRAANLDAIEALSYE